MPDRRTVPLAGGGCIDGSRRLVVNGVVDGPALAERAADVAVAPVCVALEHEGALASADQKQRA